LIELNIIEYDQTGVEHQRSGNRIGSTAPEAAMNAATAYG
jgi:hypothetical protein